MIRFFSSLLLIGTLLLNSNSQVSADTTVKDVIWTNALGVTVSGSNITKNQNVTQTWGNAGASSQQLITSGDGYVEFSTSENTKTKIAGLGKDDNDQSQADIYHAIELIGGEVFIRENSSLVGSSRSTYAAGDVFKVAIEYGTIRYYKNGAVLYTSNSSPLYPMALDTAIYSLEGTITNAKIFATNLQTTPPPSPTPTPAPTPTPTPPPSSSAPIFTDGTLINHNGTIYVIEFGKKRGFTSMQVFSGLGYKLSNIINADVSTISQGDVINSASQRHPRGALIVDNGTVYFMGTSLRYPFPSAQVFTSWNNKFEHIVHANNADRAVTVGSTAQMK